MKSTKKALFMSCLSLLLCVSMLVGTTFAWFTDSVTSGVNQIIAGNLDIEVSYKVGDEWQSIQGVSSLFSSNLWEPGHTEYVTLKVENKGTLALNYKLMVTPASENGGINVAGQPFKLSDYLMFGTTAASTTEPTYTRETARAAATNTGLLNQIDLNKSNTMLAGANADYITLVIYMPETVGNDANYKTGTTAPQINLGITVLATQMQHEVDSFDKTYDAGAVTHTDYAGVGAYYDYFEAVNVTATSDDDSKFTVEKSGVAGVSGETAVANTPVDLVVTKSSDATVNFTGIVGDGQEVTGYDIKVTGQKPGSLVQAKLYVGTGLTDFTFHHDSEPMEVGTKGSLTNGQFYYDAADGYVYFATTSFSPYQATYKAPVAAIGSAVYGTFADAMAVANGKTVTLLKSCSGNGVVVPSGSSVTVNFNGFTYNVDGTTVGSTGTETNGFQLLKDSTIIFKNGVLTSDKAKLLIQNYSDLTLDNMVIDGTKLTGYKYAASNNNGKVTIKNTTINAASDGVAFDVYSFGSYTGANVTVENSVINGKIEVGADANVNISNLKLTIKSGTINGAIVPSEGFAGKISIEGGTFSTNPSDFVVDGKFASKNSNGMYVIEAVPVAVDNVYSISNAAQLQWIASKVNAGDRMSGKTVKLTADIDLSGIEWTPIGNLVSYPGITFAGTFDGQNHVISNMKAVCNPEHGENAVSAFFGSTSGATIKDVTFKNADVTSLHYAAVVVAYEGSNSNKTYIDGVTIENCKVVTTPFEENSKWDNGDKAGAVVGYCTSVIISDCTVKNTSVTGYRDLGGIIGCGDGKYGTSVTGCSVQGVTINVNNEHNYKNYSDVTEHNVGDYIGRLVNTPVTTDNTGNVTVNYSAN